MGQVEKPGLNFIGFDIIKMDTKTRCRDLRMQGYSINKISQLLGLSKSTVHWHVHDMVLTQEQKERLQESWYQIMQQVNARRRGKSLKNRRFARPSWNPEFVRLLAHFLFDGRIDEDECYYLARFQDKIGFSSGVRINPERKNGQWKYPFEKRKLLKLALNSYQAAVL